MKPKSSRLKIRKFVREAPDGVFSGPEDGVFRLNHNETTGLISAVLAKKALLADIKALSEYPTYGKLHARIARYAGVKADFVQTTNGSDDAIPKLMRLLFEGKKSVILTVPAFPSYERMLRLEKTPILAVAYEVEKGEFSFPMKRVLQAIQSGKTQGLIICNPSNPMGVGINTKDLFKLASATRKQGIPLVVDEAYFEFHRVSAVPLLKTHPNVIILRTFSKTFGLAGLRLGYVIAHPEIIKALQKFILPWEVNHAAVSAGLLLLGKKKYFLAELKKTEKRRDTMRALFKRFNVRTFNSRANFIICKTPRMERLVAILEKHKVVVKSMSPGSRYLPFLADCFRISVPGPDIAKKAMRAIESALKEFSKTHAR